MCVIRWFDKVGGYSHWSHLFRFEQIAVRYVQNVQNVQSVQVGVESVMAFDCKLNGEASLLSKEHTLTWFELCWSLNCWKMCLTMPGVNESNERVTGQGFGC